MVDRFRGESKTVTQQNISMFGGSDWDSTDVTVSLLNEPGARIKGTKKKIKEVIYELYAIHVGTKRGRRKVHVSLMR